MTIFGTWQLIVTLDSIRNSCDVFIIWFGWYLFLICLRQKGRPRVPLWLPLIDRPTTFQKMPKVSPGRRYSLLLHQSTSFLGESGFYEETMRQEVFGSFMPTEKGWAETKQCTQRKSWLWNVRKSSWLLLQESATKYLGAALCWPRLDSLALLLPPPPPWWPRRRHNLKINPASRRVREAVDTNVFTLTRSEHSTKW